ncbi:MAG: hypothetical protein ACE5KE_14865 [Methanosarcinales archaeon]
MSGSTTIKKKQIEEDFVIPEDWEPTNELVKRTYGFLLDLFPEGLDVEESEEVDEE